METSLEELDLPMTHDDVSSGFVNNNQAFEAISPSGVKIKFVLPSGTTVIQWRGWPVK